MTVKARMVALTARLLEGRAITSRYVRREFAVSKATAKRDLQTLESALPVRTERIGRGPTAKKRLTA